MEMFSRTDGTGFLGMGGEERRWVKAFMKIWMKMVGFLDLEGMGLCVFF